MFGKRKAAPAQFGSKVAHSSVGQGSGAGSGRESDRSDEPASPWSDDPSSVACNFAAANIANNLGLLLSHDNQVHAETYVAAAGAIAGFAAQQSLLAFGTPERLSGLRIMESQSGRKYFFGDPINDMLLPKDKAAAHARVWSIAAGAALGAGLPAAKLPSVDRMFAHVAASIGTAEEGFPSIGEPHRPHYSGLDLLRGLWPHVSKFLAGDIDDFHRKIGPVPQQWWGPIAAYVSGRPIIEVKHVLAPDVALTILMETAIYTSKVERELVVKV